MKCHRCGSELEIRKLPQNHVRAVCTTCKSETFPYKTENQAIEAYLKNQTSSYVSGFTPRGIL